MIKTETIPATTPTSPEPKTKEIGTQFFGNHAAIQVDLAPKGMYGTNSHLDARFTLESGTLFGGGLNSNTQQQHSLNPNFPPPPPSSFQPPTTRNPPVAGIWGPISQTHQFSTPAFGFSPFQQQQQQQYQQQMQSNAYIELLKKAREEAAEAKAELERVLAVGAKNQPQTTFAEKSKVGDLYEGEKKKTISSKSPRDNKR